MQRTAGALALAMLLFPAAAGSQSIEVGKTVLFSPRMQTTGCTLGPNPDRQCSPSAHYSKLTKAVICSSTYRTSTVRHVPE